MSAWITDMEPTIQDTDKCGRLWVSYGTGSDMIHFTDYRVGLPWQPITYPEPYQKPKVWGWGENTSTYANITKDKYVCFHIHFSDRITPAHIDAIVDALNRLEDSHD